MPFNVSPTATSLLLADVATELADQVRRLLRSGVSIQRQEAMLQLIGTLSMDKDNYKGQESKKQTYFSWSVLAFYAPLAAAGITVAVVSASSGEDADQPCKHRHHALGATPNGQPADACR